MARTHSSENAFRYRLTIAARTLLAVLGGYGFAALCCASLALALPLPKPQAVLAATQLSFALYCALAIWAFSAKSVRRAWCVATLLCAIPAAHLLMRSANV
ncbi:MAG: hypothetical protein E2596_00275 [Pseudomonas sp.]|jgi:hypothetical protein|uniref:DUF3649 domain-containing protein n=2 Tax=Pseudomonadaceae TaxID=135621 RepID=A0A1I5U969_9GAMM|nr:MULTISPECIES: hypothetical protein [Pseudomonas]PKM04240.1 MAG: hypothetical protein CVV16_05915 [Gammaproteobacteria bacterium HGW-Gammaproteobacteria-6]RAR35351.1 hypothetical protein DP092_12995 [Pseudomonas sp. MDMC224]MBA4681146.1 hypothetical protein [Pseudomonas sp.]MDI5996201.1 hypothetical protein [Pseudomonas sp. MDMC216]MDI6008731.1 hypothetical protein [Pseudomonas sp. MDMC17]